jgi:hypothetical protein
MLHKDCDRKGSVEKKSLVVRLKEAWRQDELTDGKPPVVKKKDFKSSWLVGE